MNQPFFGALESVIVVLRLVLMVVLRDSFCIGLSMYPLLSRSPSIAVVYFMKLLHFLQEIFKHCFLGF